MERQRRIYSLEFKLKAVELSNQRGSLISVANELNVSSTKAQYGNGIFVQNLYANFSGQLYYQNNSSLVNGGLSYFKMQYQTVGFPQKGLITQRTTTNFNNNYLEDFTYDELDRLTSYPNELGVIENQTYAENGRIASNSNGVYNYATISKPYRNTSIDVNTTSKNYYLNSALQQISYSALKKPVSIYQESTIGVAKERIDFLYNVGESRSTMFYGDTNSNKFARKFRRYYSAGGTMEITEDRDASGNIIGTNFITYIGGDAYSATVILKSDGTNQNYLYLHRDNLGSILTISDQAKQLLERRIFDAWGNLIKLQNSAGQYVINNGQTLIANYQMLLDRGYTGHEHMFGVGLINMNGRLYDPKLRRFIMPDNNLQDPTNSQNFNRYGYVLNNPLMYIDPSGESGTPCDGCPGDFGGNGNGGFGYYYNNNYVQTGASVNIFSSAANLIRDWDELGIKDWAKQNFNFNNWSNSLGNPNPAKFFDTNFTSVRDFLVDNVIQSTIDDVRDFVKDIFGGGSKSKSPQITYQPANAYSFASGGGTSAFVTSKSTSPGGGYNSNVEMHPYVNEVPSMYNNYQGQNYNTTGAVTTGLGTAFTAAEIKMFNQTSWYSIKQFKTYGQNFNGNGATGGKLALAKRVSTGFKIGGYGLGVFNGVSTFSDYLNGNISTQSFITEQASNAYSTFGGMYGAAWGVGWEGGRWITHREFYRNWKRETWLPWRMEHWGY